MIPFGRNLPETTVNTYMLVLAARRIPFRLTPGPHGWQLWVPAGSYAAALGEIARYLDENRPVAAPAPEAGPLFMSPGGAAAAGLIAVVHLLTSGAAQRADLIYSHAATARRIVSGQGYRTVTALLLHADAAHLAGNMAGLAVFGTPVGRIWGHGLGWLLILVCGAGGNWLTALLYQTGHRAIGASTAVFGALGLLTAHGFRHRRRASNGRVRRAWPALAGGVMLLLWLGSAPHTDVMAHLAGFALGLGLGSAVAPIAARPPGRAMQHLLLAALAVILAVCWLAGR